MTSVHAKPLLMRVSSWRGNPSGQGKYTAFFWTSNFQRFKFCSNSLGKSLFLFSSFRLTCTKHYYHLKYVSLLYSIFACYTDIDLENERTVCDPDADWGRVSSKRALLEWLRLIKHAEMQTLAFPSISRPLSLTHTHISLKSTWY